MVWCHVTRHDDACEAKHACAQSLGAGQYVRKQRTPDPHKGKVTKSAQQPGIPKTAA
jgi:hypothetical protein